MSRRPYSKAIRPSLHRLFPAALAAGRATYALWRFVRVGLWGTRGAGLAGCSFLDHPPLLNRLPHGTKRDEVLLLVRVHRRVCFSDLDCRAGPYDDLQSTRKGGLEANDQ